MVWHMWLSYHMLPVLSYWLLSMHSNWSMFCQMHEISYTSTTGFSSWTHAILTLTPLSYVLAKHSTIRLHFYADNTQLYGHLTHQNAVSTLDDWMTVCLMLADGWLPTNIKLNPDKTLILWFLARSTSIGTIFPVNILGTLVNTEKTCFIHVRDPWCPYHGCKCGYWKLSWLLRLIVSGSMCLQYQETAVCSK